LKVTRDAVVSWGVTHIKVVTHMKGVTHIKVVTHMNGVTHIKVVTHMKGVTHIKVVTHMKVVTHIKSVTHIKYFIQRNYSCAKVRLCLKGQRPLLVHCPQFGPKC
jgi:uncharacterized protein YpuA (DUF1002 family)